MTSVESSTAYSGGKRLVLLQYESVQGLEQEGLTMIRSDPSLAEMGQPGQDVAPLFAPLRRSSIGHAFTGRAVQRAALENAMGQDQWQGAVVVGEAGIGKTALVRNHLLSPPTPIVSQYLRGTALMANIPYGILGLLMGKKQTGASGIPSLVEVVQAIVENFGAALTGGTPLVVVDNAEYADNWSAMALSELVRKKFIKLTVVCRRINGIPADFSRLWRTGQLLRINVPAMDAGDVRALICSEVDGPCSLAAATMLRKQSSGNPLYLRALVRRAVAAGALCCVDGIWVWCEDQGDNSLPPGLGQLNRLMNCVHGNMQILELVATSGSLSVASLMSLHSSQELDELLSSGDLRYVGSGKSSVAVAHPVLANVLPVLGDVEKLQPLLASVEDFEPAGSLMKNAMEGEVAPASNDAFAVWEHLGEALVNNGLKALSRDQIQHCSQEQARWVAQYAEKLSINGRQDDALTLATVLAKRLAIAENQWVASLPTAGVPVELAAPLLRIYTISGEWKLLAELLSDCQERGLDGDLVDCVEFELSSGFVSAFQGERAVAVQLLSQGSAQLKQFSLPGWEAAASIASWSTSVVPPYQYRGSMRNLSDQDEAHLVGLFDVVMDDPDVPSLMVSLVQCLLVGTLAVGSGTKGAYFPNRHGSLALKRFSQSPAHQMLILAAQVDGSVVESCEELLMVASTQEGVLAEVLGLYAKGLLTQDSAVLVQTVDRACHMNFPALSALAAEQALLYAPASSLRSVRRQLQRLVHLPADLSEQANDLNTVLTDREQAVGLLAAQGDSNKGIAYKLGVSVRTVEGHLYQVYAKLQVSSRVELLPLLSQSAL
ncbi:LuxR C-terminal-related transcriptional regulator [Arthrobacter psychrochitiniphilus]|uniref:helix-turn-helix transcriptional regulator n=1 Tax=Arthrobacter psychrochitiniphilus TaxID=291045 RepID=UPI003F7B4DE9